MQLPRPFPLIFNRPAWRGEGQSPGFPLCCICEGITRTPHTRGSKRVGPDLGRGDTGLLPGLMHRGREQNPGNSKAESYKGPTIPGDIEEEKARKEANCLITYFINTLIIYTFLQQAPQLTKIIFPGRIILKTNEPLVTRYFKNEALFCHTIRNIL